MRGIQLIQIDEMTPGKENLGNLHFNRERSLITINAE
jgi:hypothetical protein